MVTVGSILGAVFADAACYCMAAFMSKRRGIIFLKRNIMIDLVLTFCVTFALGLLYMPKGITVEIIMQYILICAMSVFALADAEHHFISNQLLLTLFMMWLGITGLAIIFATQYGLALMFRSLTGAIAGGLIFLLCFFLSRGQLGAGDVKLAFVMGLYLTGDRIIGAVLYGVVICCIFSIVQLIRKKIGVKDGVPLAPFLYLGQLIAYFISA